VNLSLFGLGGSPSFFFLTATYIGGLIGRSRFFFPSFPVFFLRQFPFVELEISVFFPRTRAVKAFPLSSFFLFRAKRF